MNLAAMEADCGVTRPASYTTMTGRRSKRFYRFEKNFGTRAAIKNDSIWMAWAGRRPAMRTQTKQGLRVAAGSPPF